MSLPKNYQLTYSPEQISGKVASLAAQLNSWIGTQASSTAEQVLCVCVLRGGVHFFSDLLRELCFSVEPFFCRVSSYSSTTNEQGEALAIELTDVNARGRRVLLVDDICDSGNTLAALSKRFLAMGAAEVKSAVFLHRVLENPVHTPTWSAVSHTGDEWFVGYGMEDKNRFSNLPGIYLIRKW